MTAWFLVLIVAWLLFNWLAPLSLLANATRMSIGRVPKDILDRANAYHVHYYVAKLNGPLALSTWLGWKYAVVLDRNFLQNARADQVRFVLAHELGHCALHHLQLRWLCTVLVLSWIPTVNAYLRRKEEDADAFAEELSGLPRTVLSS